MERKKYLLMLILFFSTTVYAGTSYKEIIYNAYIMNDMSKWEKTIDAMNSQPDKSNAFMMELVNYQYGYIAWCLGNDKNKLAEQYLRDGEKNLDILEERNYQLTMINAYRAAFYGYRIKLNIFKAPFYGPKSLKCARLSIDLDPKNPYGYIQLGNSQYYMPEVFGGSKTLALEYYQKAEMLFEKDTSGTTENWNYLNLLVTIAQAFDHLKDYDSARRYYQKILSVEPAFAWVKNELYPALLKKMNNNPK